MLHILSHTAPQHSLKGIVHESPSASCILAGVTVYKLLLREGDQLAGVDGVCALNGTGGGECPAGAALWEGDTLGKDTSRLCVPKRGEHGAVLVEVLA